MVKKIFAFLFLVIFISGFVVADDVAYIYRNERKVEQGFLDVFEDLGLSVELVESKNIRNFNFSGYDFLFIGDERLRNIKHLPEMPVIVANRYYGKDFGIIEKGRISKLSSNSPLSVNTNNYFDVYNQASFKLGGRGIPYYYIPEKYRKNGSQVIAATPFGSKRKSGDVVSYLPNKCFFGITKTEFWTGGTKNLFRDCVNHVLGGYVDDPVDDPVDDDENETLVHDVMIDSDYSNGVGGIRIKDKEFGNYLLDNVAVLYCNKKYTISFKTLNIGNFSENVSIGGVLGNFEWDTLKNNLASGKSTTTGSKTINISLSSGFYNLVVGSNVNDDINLENNVRHRSVEVVC